MSDTTASIDLDTGGMPGGLGDLLTQARQALAASQEPNADVAALNARLAALEDRLGMLATNLDMALEMFSRLPVAWNVLAEVVNELTETAGSTLGRLGLSRLKIPKV